MKKNNSIPELNVNLAQYTEKEKRALEGFVGNFIESKDCPELIMSNFSRFVRFQDITRFLVMYEIYNKIINTHGSIIEVGVLNGFNIFSFAHFCEIFEPRNYTRKIYGFDTFDGYQAQNPAKDGEIGVSDSLENFKTESFEKLESSVDLFNDSIQFN